MVWREIDCVLFPTFIIMTYSHLVGIKLVGICWVTMIIMMMMMMMIVIAFIMIMMMIIVIMIMMIFWANTGHICQDFDDDFFDYYEDDDDDDDDYEMMRMMIMMQIMMINLTKIHLQNRGVFNDGPERRSSHRPYLKLVFFFKKPS